MHDDLIVNHMMTNAAAAIYTRIKQFIDRTTRAYARNTTTTHDFCMADFAKFASTTIFNFSITDKKLVWFVVYIKLDVHVDIAE